MAWVHGVRLVPTKWSLGRALCGCNLSRYSGMATKDTPITCPRCLRKVEPTMPSAKYYKARPATWRACECGCGVLVKGTKRRRFVDGTHQRRSHRAQAKGQPASSA